jgi:hypothetical protein
MKYERMVIHTTDKSELESEIEAHLDYRFVQAIEWQGANYLLVFEREVVKLAPAGW